MNGHHHVHFGKKTYFVTKLAQDSSLRGEIVKSFDNPENYFNVSNEMVIGKVIKGPRYNHEFKLIPHSIVGTVEEFEEGKKIKKSSHPSNKLSVKSSSNSTLFPNVKKPEVRNTDNYNYEVVDEQKIETIFKKFNNLKIINQDRRNEFMDNLPADVKNCLKYQEEKLTKFENNEMRNDKFVKYISKLTNKPEERVLMNSLDSHLANEPIFINYQKQTRNPSKFHWNLSLRKSKKFSDKDETLVNIGSDIRPIWVKLKESQPYKKEIFRKPLMNKLNNNDTSHNSPSVSRNVSALNENLRYTYNTSLASITNNHSESFKKTNEDNGIKELNVITLFTYR